MKNIPKNKLITKFNKENRFNYQVELGEFFSVETPDCYNEQIKSEKIKRTSIDSSTINSSVGPIEIQGVLSGDTIEIEIVDIELGDSGIMVTSPGLGVLGDLINEPDTKIIPINNGYAKFSENLKFPITPMVGVIGTTPIGESIHCGIPGDHGGNLDSKVIKKGSKLYLPVFINGAGLAVGDIHGCMGDGELSGTGIEISGKITMRILKQNSLKIKRPMVETKNNIYTLASAKELNSAIKCASKDMVDFLMLKLSLPFPDAYRVLSATCDIEISQIVNELVTVRVKAPKLSLGIMSII